MRRFVIGGFSRPQTRSEQLIAFLVRWLITAVGVWVAAEIVGGIHLDGWRSVLLVALILGLLNAFVKPVLVFLSIPALLLTLGFFLIIVNTVLLALTAWISGKFDSVHFAVDGFWAAFWGAVIISIVSFLLSQLVNPKKVARRFG